MQGQSPLRLIAPQHSGRLLHMLDGGRTPSPDHHLTGVPFLDALVHGALMLAPPVHAAASGSGSVEEGGALSWLAPGLRPVEVLLMMLWYAGRGLN